MNKYTDLLCQKYLNILYHQTISHYKPTHIAETRGEILYESIHKLIPMMGLKDHDVFVDLGSANGKIVAQIFLTTPVKTSIGIEIVPELHSAAMRVSQRIKNDLPYFYENDREMSFIQGNFLDKSLDNMTVALINATCFPPSLLNELGKIIHHTSTIRLVLSLRPLITLQRLVCKKIIPIECSWDSTLCYCYE
jgi:histone methylation protein DOT1